MQATVPDITTLTGVQLAQLHTYAIAVVRAGAARPDFLATIEAERARRDPSAIPAAVTPPKPVGPDRRISRTRLTSGFTTIDIDVTVVNGQADVTGTRLYATYQTTWVEDVKTRTFFNLPDAEKFAADWVERLAQKGWKR